MNNTNSTKENINKLIEFRQAVYQHGITVRRDAVFDLLDALIWQGPVSSFAMLSQAEQFQRKWPSLYAAVEDGQLDEVWLRTYLAQQVPQTGFVSLPWMARPGRVRVPEHWRIASMCFQASSDVNGGTIAIGYPYSSLDWVKEAHASWALPVDERRVAAAKRRRKSVRTRSGSVSSRAAFLEALDIVACDGKYGNAGFLRSVKGNRCGIVAACAVIGCCMARPRPVNRNKRGATGSTAQRFAFKEPDTWGEPDEVIELEDPYWGQVRLERWNRLARKERARMCPTM